MASDPISSCIFSEIGADGVLRIAVALDAAPGATASGKSLETMQPLGLIARPRDPEVLADGTTGGAANAMYVFSGGEGFVMPLLDPRFVTKVPPVKKGGTALYSAPGGILNFDGDDGTTLLLTPAKNGASHVLALDNPNDAVQLRHARGHGIAMLGDGTKPIVANNAAGNVCVVLDDNGVVISGNTQIVGSLVVGQVTAALPVALADAYGAWATVISAMVGSLATFANGIAPGTVSPVLVAALPIVLEQLSTIGKSTVLKASPTP